MSGKAEALTLEMNGNSQMHKEVTMYHYTREFDLCVIAVVIRLTKESSVFY